jgi:putative inorganic carbon (hco3(-)) transporter
LAHAPGSSRAGRIRPLTALSPPRGRTIALGRLGWGAAAVVTGIFIGVATVVQPVVAGLAIIVAPLLFVLLLRLEWIPALVMASVFGEAINSGSVTLSRAVGPLVVLAMILGLSRHHRIGPNRLGLPLAVIAYSTWAVASVAWTVNPDNSLSIGGTGYSIAQLGLSISVMLPMIMFVRSEDDLVRLMRIVWLLATVTGLISIEQFLAGGGRSVGVSGDANFFAALQVIALPLGALLVIETRSSRLRLLVLMGVAIGVGSIMTTLSRGGILALAAVFMLLSVQPARGFFRTRARKRAFLSVVAAGAGILLVVAYSALSARTSSLFSGGDTGSGRTNLWSAAITGWHSHEIRGIGFGAFIGQSNQLLLETPGVNFSAYALRPTGQYVHNAYLESLVELGIIGAGLFVAVLVAMAISLRKTARDAVAGGQPFISAFARALLLSLAGFAFTSIFLSTETDHTLWVIIGLAIALPRVLLQEQRRHAWDRVSATPADQVGAHRGGSHPFLNPAF